MMIARDLAVAVLLASISATAARGSIPALPAGATTHWIVREPREIVTYVTFDPVTVERELPPELRFVTVGELAATGVGWAGEYLAAHPAHGGWGVSFLEIVRAGRFEINGRSPRWPRHGAAALWCARVAPTDTTRLPGPGRPFLLLEFWVPDRAYVARMRILGHHAAYGDVRLLHDTRGTWRGTVRVPGLDIAAACRPVGGVSGGASSAGTQVFFPPRSSAVRSVVRVAFAGHRERECSRGSTWRIRGTHPLAGGVVLSPALFEYGYELEGGAYPR